MQKTTNSKSFTKDAGSLEIINQLPGFITFDINNINRTSDGKPDIGAYERIED